jgi:predicted ATPase
LFSRVAYLGPLREYPQRSYVWAGEDPSDVGRKGELAIPALLSSRGKKTLSQGKGRPRLTVEEKVAMWLKEMDMIHSFSLIPIAENRKDYEVRIKKSENSPEVLITDVGFGVSQILPVLALCYYVPDGSIIILEQPEIHLHPFVQSALADVLIDTIKNRNVQIIVESHSEHLLRRLQRRIAEEVLEPEKAALYFCSMAGASSKIERLEIDRFGNIRNWPKGFFGDEMGDLLAMTEAAMKAQGAGQ